MFSNNLLTIFAMIIISTNYISNIFALDVKRENNAGGGTNHQSDEKEGHTNLSFDGSASRGVKKELPNKTEHIEAINSDTNGAKGDDGLFKNAFVNPSKESGKSEKQQKEIDDPHRTKVEEIEMRENVRLDRMSAQRFPTHQIIFKHIQNELNGNTTEANGIRTNEKWDKPSLNLLMSNAQEIVDQVNSDPERKWQAENFPYFHEMDTEDILRIAGRLDFCFAIIS